MLTRDALGASFPAGLELALGLLAASLRPALCEGGLSMRWVSLWIMVVPFSAFADPVAVFVGQTIDVRPDEVAAFASICTQAYAGQTQRESVAYAEAASALKETGNAAAAARKVGAGEYLAFELVRLAGDDGTAKVIVTAVRAAATGTVLHRADLVIANFEDSPAACDRLVKAAIGGLTSEQTRDRHNVTIAEDRAGNPPRTGAPKVIGFKASFAKPVGDSALYSPVGAVQFNMIFEREPFFIEIGAGVLLPANKPGANAANYGGVISELGGDYYLSEGDTAPFVGLGVQPRILTAGSIINLAPYAQGGVMFWRQSHVRLYAEARVAQNVLPVAGADSTGTAYPTELSLQLGMGF
jgi:hypothetical protein